MEWRDQDVADALARNLQKLKEQHGFSSNRALHNALLEWSKTKPHATPLAINTLRNIDQKSHSPSVETLTVLADYFNIPVYMLLIDGMRFDAEFTAALELVVKVFIDSEADESRAALKALADALKHKTAA